MTLRLRSLKVLRTLWHSRSINPIDVRLNVRFIGVLLGGILAMGQAPIPGRANATGYVTFQADFKSHTSLRVSSSELRFDVAAPDETPRATIDFTASGRTYSGGEVLLTVEPAGGLQSPEGGPASAGSVAFEGAAGTSGTLSPGPHVVGHWMGSGVRSGAVSFTLRGAQAPGVYVQSLKFVLSTP